MISRSITTSFFDHVQSIRWCDDLPTWSSTIVSTVVHRSPVKIFAIPLSPLVSNAIECFTGNCVLRNLNHYLFYASICLDVDQMKNSTDSTSCLKKHPFLNTVITLPLNNNDHWLSQLIHAKDLLTGPFYQLYCVTWLACSRILCVKSQQFKIVY